MVPTVTNYPRFVHAVKTTFRANIPRGIGKLYILGLLKDVSGKVEKHAKHFSIDPYADETIKFGDELLRAVGLAKQEI